MKDTTIVSLTYNTSTMQTFENRQQMLSTLVPQAAIIIELGVFMGEFANFINQNLKPSKLHLVDTWSGDICSGDQNGNNVVYVNGGYAYEHVKLLFANEPNVNIVRDYSYNFMSSLPDKSVDMIYIDADHSYEGVKKDLDIAIKKVKDGGWIMGHDYYINMQKCMNMYDFGVGRAVDEFVKEHNLKIDALAMDGCVSFAIRKGTSPPSGSFP